jgi:glycosyltransferase
MDDGFLNLNETLIKRFFMLKKQMNFSLLERIGNSLIIHSPLVSSIGLMNGKAGDVICLYHLHRILKKDVYEETIERLIDLIYEEIHSRTLLNFSSGLAGIGCCIEYLVRENFLETDDDTLEEFDEAVFQLDKNKYKPSEKFFDFYGPGLYYLMRTASKQHDWDNDAIKFLTFDLISIISSEKLHSETVEISNCYLVSLAGFISETKHLFPQKLVEEVSDFVNERLKSGDLNIVEKIILHNSLIRIDNQLNINDEIEKLTDTELLKACSDFACYNMVFPKIAAELQLPLQNKLNPVIEIESMQKQLFESDSGLTGLSGLYPFIAGMKQDKNVEQSSKLIPEINNDFINLYVFNETSRAAIYGIGTYINELILCLKNVVNMNLNVVQLNDENKEFTIEINERTTYWKISENKYHSNDHEKQHKLYYQSVVTLLKQYIPTTENMIVHFNYLKSLPLLNSMKSTFNCKTVSVVHYSDWFFLLNGNMSRLRSILVCGDNTDDFVAEHVLKSFGDEKLFFEASDHIICLASYMKDILCEEYKLKHKNISVVPNGLNDTYKPVNIREVRKRKYFNNREKIILFAGRLDDIKGLQYLISAFREVLKSYTLCRLVIAGNGIYDLYMKETKDICAKMTYTGLLDKSELYELYSIADIGVVPSLYEPFGYVAVEMMMHALPLVVTATSGLNEIVDDTCGFKIPIIEFFDEIKPDTSVLTDKILYLLQNPDKAKELGNNARRRYLEKYSTDVFRNNMLKVYNSLIIKSLTI